MAIENYRLLTTLLLLYVRGWLAGFFALATVWRLSGVCALNIAGSS